MVETVKTGPRYGCIKGRAGMGWGVGQGSLAQLLAHLPPTSEQFSQQATEGGKKDLLRVQEAVSGNFYPTDAVSE